MCWCPAFVAGYTSRNHIGTGADRQQISIDRGVRVDHSDGVNAMVRRSRLAVTGAHYGAKDWLAQRMTALLMTIYLIVLAGVLLIVAPQDYAGWKDLFQSQWLRIATFVFFICVFWHAWVGVRNVLMDYVHSMSIRLMMQIAVVTALLFYLVWTAEILWS